MMPLARDDRITRSAGGVRFREAWRFKDGIRDLILAHLATCPRPVLHVCSGSSNLGDLRLDAFHPGADVRADARQLPFADRTWGTILADTPWSLKDWSMADRMAYIREAGRVLVPGGVLLHYAPWWPRPLWADLEEPVFYRTEGAHDLPHDPVALTRWKKREELRDDAKTAADRRRRGIA